MKIKELFSRFQAWRTKETCYAKMEAAGSAANGTCHGQWGGEPSTNWLSWSCMGCKFYDELQEVK